MDVDYARSSRLLIGDAQARMGDRVRQVPDEEELFDRMQDILKERGASEESIKEQFWRIKVSSRTLALRRSLLQGGRRGPEDIGSYLGR